MKFYAKRKRECLAILICILAIAVLSACDKKESGGDDNKIVFTTGVGKDEVFRIGDEVCKKEELLVYLTTVQNQYESVYGAQIWKVSRDEVTVEDSVKDTVLARIAQIKTMYAMAVERGIELSDQEQRQVENASNTYFNSLSEYEKDTLGVSPDTVRKLYLEYAMAEKIYQTIIQDINPEISDDEARTITVQHILIKTYHDAGQGLRIPYSNAERQTAYEKAVEVRQKALDGKSNFEELAIQYSDDDEITCSFGKGEMDQTIEDVAFGLATDQISEIVENEDGYHIYKCISTFNREETDANKIKIVEKRREAAFGQEYDAYVSTQKKQLNEELWENLTMLHDSRLTTADFFDVYGQFVYVEPYIFQEEDVKTQE